jgi:hypothetical protein
MSPREQGTLFGRTQQEDALGSPRPGPPRKRRGRQCACPVGELSNAFKRLSPSACGGIKGGDSRSAPRCEQRGSHVRRVRLSSVNRTFRSLVVTVRMQAEDTSDDSLRYSSATLHKVSLNALPDPVTMDVEAHFVREYRHLHRARHRNRRALQQWPAIFGNKLRPDHIDAGFGDVVSLIGPVAAIAQERLPCRSATFFWTIEPILNLKIPQMLCVSSVVHQVSP